jgi:hypothetical protein
LQASVDLKAPLAGPTFTGAAAFTGTVSAPTVAIDASTNVATNAAVKAVTDLKAPLAGPTFTGAAAFTGTVSAPTIAIDASTNVATNAAVKAVTDLLAPIASPVFTGTVNAPNMILSGNLTVNGITTTISSTTLDISDKNITLGKTESAATDAGASGGGITLKGTNDKIFNWYSTNGGAWTSSENVNLVLGKKLLVNGDEVYARLANPTFTGSVIAPTVAIGDNSTKVATTAAVKAVTDLKAPIASPTFTGTATVNNLTVSGNLTLTEWIQRGLDIDGEAASNYSGTSVSFSADGNIVAIGANNNNGNGNASGQVRVYYWDTVTVPATPKWTQRGLDIDGEAAGDQSGVSVSLSADGNIVAIGAIGNSANGGYSGQVRVYYWDTVPVTPKWSKRGLDIDGEAAGDQSGYSVSLSADGNIVAIGANNNNGNGNASGQVRVYYWDTVPATPKWTQRGLDIDGEAANNNSGMSVSLSANGNIVAIGAIGNSANGGYSGQVRVYYWDTVPATPKWSQRGLDIDGEAAGDLSGISVSLSANGNTVAIGASWNSNVNGNNSGQVRVYYWDTLTNPTTPQWSKRGLDIDGENADDFSGTSVSLSADGNIVAIGANSNDGNGNNSGQVRVYYWDTVTVPATPKWTQRGLDIDGEAAGDQSGVSVSLQMEIL